MLMVFMGIYCPGYVEDKCCVTRGPKPGKVSVQVLLISVLSRNGMNNQVQGDWSRTTSHKLSCKKLAKRKEVSFINEYCYL